MKTWQTGLIVGALSVLGVDAQAAKLGDVTMEDQIEIDKKKLVLNGMGIREATLLKLDVYVAGLYLPKKTSSSKEVIQGKFPKRVLFHFVRDVSKDDVVKAWKEGFKKNGGDQEAVRERVGKFVGWAQGMSKGQQMVFTYQPATGVELKIANKVLGTVAGDDFAKVLFSIWFGPNPPNEGLKNGMLDIKD